MAPQSQSLSQDLYIRAMPFIFVFLWSTGFIGAKLGLPYVEPMTFLAIRFVVCMILMLPVVIFTKTLWPNRGIDWFHIGMAGLLMHGGYLGFVFWSIGEGVPAGTSALIAGVQPLIVAALAGIFLSEKVSIRQWSGLLLGLAGVFLVVLDKLDIGEGTVFGMALSFFALLSIAFGTLYQKKFCSTMDLKSGNFIQFIVASIYFTGFAFLFETREIIWHMDLIIALAWLILVLSLGAVTLLYILLRKGAAASVSSLFFLVPPSTAIVAYFLFGETLTGNSMIGMGVTIVGVALVNLNFGKAKHA
ncbi:EamA family transporter [Sneathiella sp. P13V-1]|uniref:DMT family transporter n=1 Tax=Sneathiella sp. P13V-1 TaxID=2697366 RepID=UPI00187B1460|nr:DMT family transporter [Sneathiella sp. P13V-1]MBE7635684.1 EamA family transporter [Sneathiella sp. P13V-1]